MKTLDFLTDLKVYEGALTNNPDYTIKFKKTLQDSVKDVFVFQTTVAAGTTDQAFSVPSSTSEYVYILCDQAISIKLNGGAETISLAPTIAGEKEILFYLRGNLSAISVTNAGVDDANLDLIIVNK